MAKGEYVRILIQHVAMSPNGAQVTDKQPAFKLETTQLTTQQVQEVLLNALESKVPETDLSKEFLG